MAGTVTHLIMAEHVVPLLPGLGESAPFFRGTVFPDIRYLGVINRSVTHPTGVRWQDVQHATDPFQAGLLFHALLDEMREQYVVQQGIYKKFAETHTVTVALKLAEDNRLYKQGKKWSYYQTLLKTIDNDEYGYQIEPTQIQRWHKVLQDYLGQSPSKNYTSFLSALGFTTTKIQAITDVLNDLNDHPGTIDCMNDFRQNFTSLLAVEGSRRGE